MAWYEVPARYWVEAEDAPSALDVIIDSIPDGRIIEMGEAKELSPAEMESFLNFQAELGQSILDADAGLLYGRDRH